MTPPSMTPPSIPPVIEVDALRDLLAGTADVVVADVRWYLDGRSGRDAYLAGHLPGAVFADVDTDLSANVSVDPISTGQPATEGRHPFPTPEAFAASMSRLGIGDDTTVVAYDDGGGTTAGRLVVMLRMLGHDAALLDGGLAAWLASNQPTAALETGPSAAPTTRPTATFTATPWPADRFASVDETVAAAAAGRPVLDARSAERFRGEVLAVDKRPGHIPGARSAPAAATLHDGRLRSPAELAQHYLLLGAAEEPAITYCGSGVSACLNVLAIEHAGLQPPRLYVASWSGYSADPERPAESGSGSW